MRNLVACSSCECLIDARESACPFCGAVHRQAGAPAWLLGLTLSLGLVSFGCVDKEGESEGASEASTTTASTSVGSTTTASSATTWDPSGNADAVTYGGPDSLSDSWSTSLDSSTWTSTGTTGTTTAGTTTEGTTTEGTTTDATTTDATTTDASTTDASTTDATSSTG